MRTKIISLFTFILSALCTLNAQAKGVITLEKTAHDFGTILEKDGNVSYTFMFTNTGDEPIIISNVSASCGCTTPEWTKGPILPGKKGSVKATYVPIGRPGLFDKSLAIISNAQESAVTIHVRGEVVQKALSVEEQYPVAIGKQLRLASSNIAFARITKNATRTTDIQIYNNGTEPIGVTFDKIPPHIKLKVEPESIAPKTKGRIVCTYETAKTSEWGFITDVISFKVNNKKADNTKLNVSATILDDFSEITSEQRMNGPYPQFRVGSQAFNNTLKGSLINTTFILTNSGETPMTIRKVSSENPTVIASASKTTVKAGESIEIKVAIDTRTFDVGAFTVSISVFSNSPRNPQANLMVTGTIIN
ncbi:MAG: DUF1573 domain-containing protein [Prevotellaceae bacterium]|jgi:hypothetical protein|nr:DUF1573 domain-containing protein [Prevotellaceae bacterium]